MGEGSPSGEAGDRAASVDAGVNAVPPSAAARLKVLVVDDELAGLRRAHVEGAFYETMSEANAPLFDELRRIARMTDHFAEVDARGDEAVATYFASDAAVGQILLSPKFEEHAGKELKKLVSQFLTRASRVATLKAYFSEAFPGGQFDLEFRQPERPALAEVLACELLFLDLFLEDGAADPVDALQRYLKGIATDAGSRQLPPIVLISSHQELETNQARFRQASEISAAGLLVLPKDKISLLTFGAHGLKLAHKQLIRQREIANTMRAFVRAWLGALDGAKEEAAGRLWNLDAAAMQQIHYASLSDADPYDEHLSELLSRAHLSHVEADPSVRAAIRLLDDCFRRQFVSGATEIENRFLAPGVDTQASRLLVSSFTWFGGEAPQSFLGANPDAAGAINMTLPFGALVAGRSISEGKSCLVHITQQCDLNDISRDRDTSQSLIFARVVARAVRDMDVPEYSSSMLVAKGLRVPEGEFDFVNQTGQVFAMSLENFLSYAREQELRVVGRLRHDIATHFVQATTNQLTRPASQKMMRSSVVRGKVFLQGAKFEKDNYVALLGDDKKAKVFSITLSGNAYSFQGDASIWIALWARQQLELIYGISDLDVDVLCTALRRGWRTERQLPGSLNARVRGGDLTKAYKTLKDIPIGDGQINFSVVIELIGLPKEPEIVEDVPVQS